MSTATLKTPSKFVVTRGMTRKSHRTLIYGVGGIGKTSLAASAPGVVFLDLEDGSADLDVARIGGVTTWRDLLSALRSDAFDGAKAICIDSLSKCEEFCRQYVIDTIPADSKGTKATSLESYGYGKGYVHLFETWKSLIVELDRQYAAGRDVILIGHDNIGKTPNPAGEDYIRHEPAIHASLRGATVQWCDHVLFVGYDVASDKGKAKGSGTRAIYTFEEATHVAKSRTLEPTPIVFNKGDASIWDKMRTTKLEVPTL